MLAQCRKAKAFSIYDRCKVRWAAWQWGAAMWNYASIIGVEPGSEALLMTEPTDDEILVKAKQLAHKDGRLWDKEDIEDAPWERNRFVDDSRRADYLNRALELLRYQKI